MPDIVYIEEGALDMLGESIIHAPEFQRVSFSDDDKLFHVRIYFDGGDDEPVEDSDGYLCHVRVDAVGYERVYDFDVAMDGGVYDMTLSYLSSIPASLSAWVSGKYVDSVVTVYSSRISYTDSSYAVTISGSSDIVLDGCIIDAGCAGVSVSGSTIELRDCTITLAPEHGDFITSDSGSTVTESNVRKIVRS